MSKQLQFVRIRPVLPRDTRPHIPCVSSKGPTDPTALLVTEASAEASKTAPKHQICHFERVFDEFFGNEAVYNKALSPFLIEPLTKGTNACVFLVGGSGSGKKHTLFNDDSKDKGILFQAFDDVRAEVEPAWKKQGVQSIKRFVQASCVSGDQIFDLLSGKMASFRLHETFEREVFEVVGAGLTEKLAKNPRELTSVIGMVIGNLKKMSSGPKPAVSKKPVLVFSIILVGDSPKHPKSQISFVVINTDEAFSSCNLPHTEALISYLKHIQLACQPHPSTKDLYLSSKLTTLIREKCHEKTAALILGLFSPFHPKSAMNCLDFLESLGESDSKKREISRHVFPRPENETEKQIDEIYEEVINLQTSTRGLSGEKKTSLVLNIEYRLARIVNNLHKDESQGAEGKKKRQIEIVEDIQQILGRFKRDMDSEPKERQSSSSKENPSASSLGRTNKGYAEHRSPSPNKSIERDLATPLRDTHRKSRRKSPPTDDIRYVNMEKDMSDLHGKINQKKLGQSQSKERRRSSRRSVGIPKPQELIPDSPEGLLSKAQNDLNELRHETQVLREAELDRLSREQQLKEQVNVLEEHLYSENHRAGALQDHLGSLAVGIEKELSIANEQNEILRNQLMDMTRNADLKIGAISQLEATLKRERIESEKTIDRLTDIERRYKGNIEELLKQVDEFRVRADRLGFEKQELINKLEQVEINERKLMDKTEKIKTRAERSIAEILDEKGNKISRQKLKIRDLRNQIKEAEAREQRFEEEFGVLKIEIEKMRVSKGGTLSDLDKTQRELIVNKQENSFMRREIERLKEELRETGKSAEELEREAGTLEDQNYSLKKAVAELESQLAECKNEMQVDMEIIKKLQSENKRVNDQVDAQKETVRKLEIQHKFVQQSSHSGIDQIEARMKEYYDEMMILREENGRFKAVNLEQKKEIIVLKEREDFAKEKLRRQKKKNEDLKRHMKEVEGKVREISNENATSLLRLGQEGSREQLIYTKIKMLEDIQGSLRNQREGTTKAQKVLSLLK